MGSILEALGTLRGSFRVALESDFGDLGAVLKQKIEYFIEICKTYKNLRKTYVFTWLGGVGGRLLETSWPSCCPLEPILDDVGPS